MFLVCFVIINCFMFSASSVECRKHKECVCVRVIWSNEMLAVLRVMMVK